MSSETPQGRPLAAIAVAVTLLLAHLPLVQLYLRRLWDLDHYSFAPLLVLGVAALLIQRWLALPAGTCADAGVPVKAAVVSLVLLSIASWLVSPWLAMISLVICAGLLLRHFTGSYWWSFLPVWALLVLLIRPPFQYDARLISRLQLESSRAASGVLEEISILHVMDGNVIRIPGRRDFLVEEACSGIHSVFALLTAAAFYAAWSRLPLIRAIPLMLSALVWAGLMNVLRITAIVFADEHFQIDLTSGWPHEAMGFVLFFLAVLMLVLTDQFLQFFLNPIPVNFAGAKQVIDKNWLARTWNRLMEAPAAVDEAAIAAARNIASRNKSSLGSAARLVAAGVICLLSVGMAGWQMKSLQTAQEPDSQVSQSLNQIDAADLPAEIDGWTRANFAAERLRAGGAFSEESKTWTYVKPRGDVSPAEASGPDEVKAFLVSLDYPFRGWHDLTNCYIGQGWEIVSRNSTTMGPREGGQPLHITEAVLSKPGQSHQLLLFTGFDETGEHIANPALQKWWVRPVWEIKRRLTRQLANQAPTLSSEWRLTTQFQLLTAIAGTTPTEEELASARDRFSTLCQEIKTQLHEKSSHPAMNQPDKTPTSPFPQRSNRKRGLRAAIGALTNFVYLWTASRPFKKLAWGLPALAVLVGLPVLSAMGSRGANPEEYAKRATQATEEKDFDAAKKWLQKLVKLQPENTRTQIVMANLMRESDGDAVADEELAKLAPLEGTQVGDPQAHRIAASRRGPAAHRPGYRVDA